MVLPFGRVSSGLEPRILTIEPMRDQDLSAHPESARAVSGSLDALMNPTRRTKLYTSAAALEVALVKGTALLRGPTDTEPKDVRPERSGRYECHSAPLEVV